MNETNRVKLKAQGDRQHVLHQAAEIHEPHGQNRAARGGEGGIRALLTVLHHDSEELHDDLAAWPDQDLLQATQDRE